MIKRGHKAELGPGSQEEMENMKRKKNGTQGGARPWLSGNNKAGGGAETPGGIRPWFSGFLNCLKEIRKRKEGGAGYNRRSSALVFYFIFLFLKDVNLGMKTPGRTRRWSQKDIKDMQEM